MKIPQENQVTVNYEAAGLPKTAKELKPAVYKEGDLFCCLLGPDPREGIFGSGDTVENALSDWHQHLQTRISSAGPDDELAQYVKDALGASTDDIW